MIISVLYLYIYIFDIFNMHWIDKIKLSSPLKTFQDCGFGCIYSCLSDLVMYIKDKKKCFYVHCRALPLL